MRPHEIHVVYLDGLTPFADRLPTMRPTVIPSLLAMSLIVACARPDTAKPASQPPAATASANGALGTAIAGRDSISDRADAGRILGSPNAPVWVIMASDFQCPFCKQWHDATFPQIMQNYVTKGRVRLAYVNFPLRMHQNSMPASEAAMCASVQNKFWQMHDALFNTQEKWESLPNATAFFDSLAIAAGVNAPLYRECISQHLTAPLIQADRDRWAARGVRSTPTFFIGDTMIEGAQPYADFQKAIDAALAKAAAKKPAG